MGRPRAKSFAAAQRAFSAHLRDPENNPAPTGLKDERVAVYRNAVFVNIEQFLADNFPRVKEFYTESQWHKLVRHYIVNHVSNTACFVELPQEFLSYLETTRDDENDPSFLYELAHFEWIETLVSTDQSKIDLAGVNHAGDLLSEHPVLNPITQLIKYSFPVHRLSPNDVDNDPPELPTYIAAYRTLENKFQFIDVNAPTARIIEILSSGQAATGRTILEAIAREIGAPDPEPIIEGGLEIFQRLLNSGVLLGTRAVNID